MLYFVMLWLYPSPSWTPDGLKTVLDLKWECLYQQFIVLLVWIDYLKNLGKYITQTDKERTKESTANRVHTLHDIH